MKMEFQYILELDKFYEKVKLEVEKQPIFTWKYIQNEWNIAKIKEDNKDILEAISSKGGVYVIYDSGIICYIGQTQGKTAKTRIINHFINKDPRTGSKLEQVQELVKKNISIGFSFIEINPPELRHFIEEKLIAELKPVWNYKGIKNKKLSNGSHSK